MDNMCSAIIDSRRSRVGNLINAKSFCFPIVLSVVIASLFTIYHITANTLVFYFGVFALFGSSLLLKPRDFLLVFVFLVPNVYIVKQIDVPTAYIGYAFLISVVKSLFWNKNRNVPLILVAHALLVLVPIVVYFDFSLLTSLIRFFVGLFFLFVFCESDYYKDDNYKRQLIKSFIFGTSFNIAVGLLYYSINSLNIFLASFSGIRSDRNYFSSVVASCLAMTFAYAMSSKKKFFYLLVFVFLLFGGLLSGSRAFMLSLIWVFLMMMFFLFNKKYWKQCLIICVLLLGLFFVFKDQLLPSAERLLARFGEDNVLSGSGRIDSWKYYMSVFVDNPINFFFGSSSKIPRYGGIDGIVQHNTFVQCLSEIGLFGTISLFAVFFRLYRKMLSGKRTKVVFFGPLFVILTCYFFINSMYSDSFTMIVFLCYVLIDLNSINRGKAHESAANQLSL